MPDTQLIDRIRNRPKCKGVSTADFYLSTIQNCFGEKSGLCPLRVFNLASEDEWTKALAESRSKLVYTDRDTQIGKQARRTDAGIFEFDGVITTTRRDRDRDILQTSGARLDDNLPLLWQHMPFEPVGAFVRQLQRTDDLLSARFRLADTPLGRDAAALIEVGALRISHGFEPDDFAPLEDEGFEFRSFEIFEVSLVSIPSNTDAIITAFSRKSLESPLVNTWAKTLFDNRTVIVKGADLSSMTETPPEDRQTITTAGAKRVTVEFTETSDADGVGQTEPATPGTKGHQMPPVIGAVEGSWEDIENKLESQAFGWLREHNMLGLPEHDVIDVELVATFQGRGIVCVIGCCRPFSEDECFEGTWEMGDDGPMWTGEPSPVQLTATIRERAIEVAQQKGNHKPEGFKAVRSEARRPTFESTSSSDWSAPDLEDFIRAYNAATDSDIDTGTDVSDLSQAVKTWIAARSLLGNADADNFRELRFFPVVEPSTDDLNENALDAVISGRGEAADIPDGARDSAQSMARSLLESEFDRDLETGAQPTHVKSFDEAEREFLAAGLTADLESLERSHERLGEIVAQQRRDAKWRQWGPVLTGTK